MCDMSCIEWIVGNLKTRHPCFDEIKVLIDRLGAAMERRKR
jgi:hypothetical protein